MSEENTQKIEKPWAVYGWFLGSWGIGKVQEEKPGYPRIQYSESQQFPLETWDPKWVKRFSNPIRAMGYFLVKQREDEPYTQGEILNLFLQNFPSERANLEKRLPNRFAQSQPSCTDERRIDAVMPGYSEGSD